MSQMSPNPTSTSDQAAEVPLLQKKEEEEVKGNKSFAVPEPVPQQQ